MDEAERPSWPGNEVPETDDNAENLSGPAEEQAAVPSPADALAEAGDALENAAAALDEASAEAIPSSSMSRFEAAFPAPADGVAREVESVGTSTPTVADEPAGGAPGTTGSDIPAEPDGDGAAVAADESTEEAVVDDEEPAVGAENAAPSAEDPMSLDAMVGELAAAEPLQEGEPSEETSEEPAEAEPEEAAETAEAAEAEPETDETPRGEPVEESLTLARRRLAGKLPFYLYAATWAVFVGTLTYLMWPDASGPFVESRYYAILVLGGLGLLAAGLVVALVTYIVLRARTESELREGLARAILLRATASMAAGALLWWAGLLALDLHRLGRIG